MTPTEPGTNREKWEALQAWRRGGAPEPLIIQGSIAACVCDGVSWADRLRQLAVYLVVSLAGLTPVSPVKIWLLRRVGVRIGRGVYISPGVVFDPLFPELVTVEDDALLGLGCRLITHEYTAASFRLGRIHVGRGAVIGAWAMVRSGVSVGAGATVGAYSFVNRDVAAGATVAGVPARTLRHPDGECGTENAGLKPGACGFRQIM